MAGYRILSLADDLTGALEVGAKFAASGVRSLVTTRFATLPRDLKSIPEVLVVDTETRHTTAAEAARRVKDLLRAAGPEEFALVYKKTDSTLRGNIGAELAAMIEEYSGSPLLYAPAYPRLGRTVAGGSLFIDGVPVTSTCFAADSLNPVRESHIPTLLAAECRFPARSVRAIDLEKTKPAALPWGIAVCDGETDSDLELAARALTGRSPFRLAAGPSALAGYLAPLARLPRSPLSPMPAAKNALVVNGSLHGLSLRQIAHAKETRMRALGVRGIPHVPPDCGWIILNHEPGPGEATLEFARDLANEVCQILDRSHFDALVIFGGDTAFAIVEAMGNPPLSPIGELMEGIPVSRIDAEALGHGKRDLLLVTKAGGFGPHDVLGSIQKAMNRG